jgi:hypothetical protein
MSCARWIVVSLVAVVGVGSSSSAVAAEVKPAAKAIAVKVTGRADLVLMVPEGWTQTIKGPAIAPTVTLSPRTQAGRRADCELLITAVPVRDASFNKPDALKRMVEASGKAMLDGSKEKTLEVAELKGEAASGYVFTLTDKAPKPGEFEFVTEGCMGVGDLLLTVTILHHQKDAPQRGVAMEIVKGARQTKSAAAAAANGEKAAPAGLRLAAPPGAAGNWGMVLGGGLKVVDDQADEARKARQVTAMNEASGMVVSIFLEPAAGRGGDSVAVRNAYWGRAKNSPIPKKDIKLGKAGDYATVEYLVPDVQQKNMNIYIVHEGTWIDVHLSKVEFTKDDQRLFDEIVNGIAFEKGAAARK